MREYYMTKLLPKWVTLTGEEGGFNLDRSFQFQLEWERKFSSMWYDLTDSERERIVPIQYPYTEQSVAEFLERLKEIVENRGIIDSIVSVLPDFTKDKPFPVKAMKEVGLIEELKRGTHPVLFSWMVEIECHGKCFAIGKYPVTQSIWECVMGTNPSYRIGSAKPVDSVSWFDCVEFCNKLSEREGVKKAYILKDEKVTCDFSAEGYRLPTEFEWAFAAQANQDFEYSGSNNVDEVAWYSKNSHRQTHPVGQKKGNGFGLYDMSGNVYEWCWDWYGYSPPTTDSRGPSTGSHRGFRGGSSFDDSSRSILSKRYWDYPNNTGGALSFRLARTL